MVTCVSLCIFLATLKISLGKENADDLEKAAEINGPRRIQVSSENWDVTDIVLTTEKCSDAIRESFKSVVQKEPMKLLKMNEIFPLKSQRDLLQEHLIRQGTRAGGIFSEESALVQLYQKALRGQDINVAIIGGSNAAGGTLEHDEKSLRGIFYNVFAEWWNATIGEWSGSHVKIHSIAISGLGSYLFAFCFDSFLPAGVQIDLIIVEQSVNFQPTQKSAPLETLTRQIIKQTELSSIIFYVNMVASLGRNPRTQKYGNPKCENLENFGQLGVARRYRITSFCLKDLLCKKTSEGSYEIRQEATRIRGVVASDLAHVGALAHAQIGLMIINYIRDVFLKILENKLSVFDEKNYKVSSPFMPAPVYNASDRETLSNPQCWLTLTPNACHEAQHPSLPIRIEKNKGFRFYDSFVDKPPLNCNGKFRKDLQRGWGSLEKNSLMRFRIFVDPWNGSGLERSRSVIIVLRAAQKIGGHALVWLDSEKQRAIRVDNIVEFGNHLFTVARCVSPGTHTVSAQTTSDGFFIISGILVGPPEFNKNGVI